MVVPAVTAAMIASVGLVAFAPVQLAQAVAPVRVAARVKAAAVTSSPDLLSARIAARSQGSRVEALSERTMDSTTWVNPNGSLTTDSFGAPVRVKDAKAKDGWADVDLTLVQRADGSVGPRVHPQGLSMAGATGPGGTSLLASLGGGAGRGVSLGWQKGLPKPVLNGARATYREVSPGVDLVQEATRVGVEQFLKLKDAAAVQAAVTQAASTGGKYQIRLPLKTNGLRGRPAAKGGLEFVDAKGRVAQVIAAPRMWDASTVPGAGPGISAAQAPVGMTFEAADAGKTRGDLVLSVDPAWLADPARVFPITIDPTTTLFAYSDTWVENDYTTAQAGSTELRVGSWDGGAHVARTYMTWDSTSFKGASVSSATLSLYEYWSYSCSARAMNIRSASPNTLTNTWTSQPAVGGVWYSPSFAKGFNASCYGTWINTDLTGLAQAWAGNAVTLQGLALWAANESDSYGWKRFNSANATQNLPRLSVTYNRKPNPAATPTIANVGTYGGIDYAWKPQPVMSSTATDPDGNNVQMTMEVHSSTTTSSSTLKSSCVTPYVASGAVGSCTAAVLPNNTTLYSRTAVVDDQGLWNGTWSAWKTFKTAQTAPPSPGISCPGYTDGSWSDTAPTTDVACTVTSAAAGTNTAVTLYPTIDGVAQPAKATGQVAYSFTLTVPRTAGGHSVTIMAQSASTLATTTQIGFGYGSASLTTPAAAPRVTTTGAISIAASGPPRGTSAIPTAKVRWRAAGSSDNELVGWNDATSSPPLTVTDNGASGIAVTGTWNTATEAQDAALDSDPNTAGVQPTVLNSRVPVLLDVQVCLTYTAGTECTWSSNKTSVLRVPHAFGNGFPTATAGPGQVALFTGEFNTSATDVTVPGYTGPLSISRSHSTFGNSTAAATDPTTSVFGPGWTAQLDGSAAGNAGLQVADGTGLDGTVAFIDGDGSTMVYSTPTGARRATAALPTGTYPAVDEDTKTSGTTLTVSLVGGVTTLTVTDADGTATTFTALAEPTSATTQVKFAPDAVTEPGNVGKTTYTRDTAGRVTRILAPVPPGVSCPTYPTTLNPGCRALRIVYAATTTATTTTPGDIAGQVSQVWLDIYDPGKAGGAGMSSIQVAAYSYDSSKRLVAEADPRSTVAATTYAYDTGNHLTSIGSGGLTPYTLTYAGSDPKLATVTRVRPADDPAGGTAILASFVYAVPSSGAGLPDLSQSAVTQWGQVAAPTYAAAVFGPDHPATSTDPTQIASANWAYADLSYTDAAGYTINTANYGAGAWQRTSADYDAHGNVIRALDARDLAQIVADAKPGEADQLATSTVYNPTDIKAADGTVLTPAGSLVTDTYGPARSITLNDATVVNARPHTNTSYDQGAPAATNPATGLPYHLPTTVTTAAADPGTLTNLPGQVVSQTLTGYDPIDGSSATGTTSGWTLGQATTSTKDMDLSGDISAGDITTRTRFDDAGRAVEARQPSAGAASTTPADAGVTLTAFYTAAAQAAPNSACGGTPQWAGLTCRTYPAADPTAGAAGAGTLPDSTTTGYNYMLSPTSVVESSGSAARTNTTTYLGDGRVDTSRTTVAGLTGSVPQSGTKTGYDITTGLAITQTKLDPVTGAVTTTVETTAYDAWGRKTSYTSDQGDVTTTSYDAAGRVAQVTDPKGAVASTYDGTDAAGNTEHRGSLTKVVVTRTGTNPATSPVLTYTGAYDAAGALTTQKLPGGITATTSLDAAGEPVGLSYTGQVTPVDAAGNPGTPTTDSWLTWTQSNDVTGRVVQEWSPSGVAFSGGPGVDALGQVQPYDTGDALGYDRTYSYDLAGRLTTVADRTAPVTGTVFDPTQAAGSTPCTVRTYAFAGGRGLNSARTSQTSTGYGPDCATGGGATTTRTSAYDSADRPTTGNAGTGQYTYDPLGRQSTLPAADAPNPAAGDLTLAYYDTDLPQAVTQAGITTSYTLDVDGHRQTATTGPTGGAATSTTTKHYTDTSDNPAWADVTTGGNTTTTRYTESLARDLGASIAADGTTTLALNNLHGDTLTNITIPSAQDSTTNATSIGPWSDYTEFGTPRDPAAATTVGGTAGYGWLGAKQRSTTAESGGLTLMGDRLYNPITGRFLSTDPVVGGNDNAYTYPTDPINGYDINGQWGCWRFCGVRNLVGQAWSRTRTIVHSHYQHVTISGNACLYVCFGASGQGGVLNLNWGQVGLGAGISGGWNQSRAPRNGRSYYFGYGGSAFLGGSYSWSTDVYHKRQLGRQHAWDVGSGGSLQVGPGYTQSYRVLRWQ